MSLGGDVSRAFVRVPASGALVVDGCHAVGVSSVESFGHDLFLLCWLTAVR